MSDYGTHQRVHLLQVSCQRNEGRERSDPHCFFCFCFESDACWHLMCMCVLMDVKDSFFCDEELQFSPIVDRDIWISYIYIDESIVVFIQAYLSKKENKWRLCVFFVSVVDGITSTNDRKHDLHRRCRYYTIEIDAKPFLCPTFFSCFLSLFSFVQIVERFDRDFLIIIFSIYCNVEASRVLASYLPSFLREGLEAHKDK